MKKSEYAGHRKVRLGVLYKEAKIRKFGKFDAP